MSEADPRRLGVHAAISVPGVPDEVPPEYVPRDVDAAEFGVRAKVAAAAERGGFVLLVGGSSVGKTRCAVEAVKALLPDWWLVHPAGPGRGRRAGGRPPPRTVVWLDELQRYLDGEHGLTGGVVRALLNAPHPVVIIGTLWPDRYTAYTAVPAPGGADPHAREREVLDLAAVIRIGPEFSPAEQDRARAAAARDPRLRVALERGRVRADPDPGGRAAAGRPLGGRPDRQPVCVGGADRGAGCGPARRPRPAQRRPAARRRAGLLHQPAAGRGAGELVRAGPGLRHRQAARRRRRPQPRRGRHGPDRRVHRRGLPDPARQPGTPLRPRARQHLGRHPQPPPRPRRCRPARRQRQEPAAVPLRHPAVPSRRRRRRRVCRRAAGRPAGRGAATWTGCGPGPTPATGMPPGGWPTCWPSAATWTGCGPGRRRRRVCRPAAGRAAGRARRPGRGRADPAGPGRRRRRAAADGWPSCWPSAATWTGPRRSCAPGPTPATSLAAGRLAGLLAERGDLDGAAQILRARADAGDGDAAGRLADLLAERGDLDGAAQILRARADAGDGDAAGRLAELLAERGDLDGLRARADAGDGYAAGRLADLLAERGDLDGLRARADAGDEAAAWRLAELLAERGDLDGAAQILRARADAGDGYAAGRLADLLAERGDLDGAAQSCAPGPTPATGTPPGGWPACWPSAATWTGCGPGPTPATGTPPGGWPICWPSAATWTGPPDPAGPGRRRRRGRRPAAGRAAGRARRPGRGRQILRARADAGDGTPPGGWPTCWPSAATWTGCGPGPTPATGMPPGGWPSCWPSAATWTGCAPGPTPATGMPPGGWPSC